MSAEDEIRELERYRRSLERYRMETRQNEPAVESWEFRSEDEILAGLLGYRNAAEHACDPRKEKE